MGFCVRAVWHGPWCFLEGSVRLTACWKSQRSQWRNSPWMKKFDVLFAVAEVWNKHWQPPATISLFIPGVLRADLHGRYVWIELLMNDIRQRFHHELHPTVKADDRTHVNMCVNMRQINPVIDYHSGTKRTAGMHQDMLMIKVSLDDFFFFYDYSNKLWLMSPINCTTGS